MKWKWITLLFILKNVYTLDVPHNSGRQPQPSNLHISSNKIMNKARHKAKLTNPTTISSSNSENDVLESYFPDVIYPTSILESAQPFYYSQVANDDVLGPFSSDVKSTYKTLTSGKGKYNYVVNGSSVLKPTEKMYVNMTLSTCDDEKLEKNAVIDDPLLSDEIRYSDEEVETDSYQNSPIYIDASEEIENEVIEYENVEGPYSSQETHKNITEYIDYLDENILLDTLKAIEKEYPKTNLYNETFFTEENNLFEEGTNDNKTVYMGPNYIMTSNTGNSYDDFVSDVMNIYSLIEESVRAVSVIDFIISKTLGTLDLLNETRAAENINFTSSITDDNNITLYDYYDCDAIDFYPICNSTELDDVLMEVSKIQSTELTSIEETDEYNVEDLYECFNEIDEENVDEKYCIIDGASELNITSINYNN